jgi:hypothetical protein
MLALRLSSPAKFAIAAVAGVLLLSSGSSAQNRYEEIFPGGATGVAHSQARAHYSTYPTSTPSDFVSSHVCINGYRWITRDLDRGWESPAQNAIPVRC